MAHPCRGIGIPGILAFLFVLTQVISPACATSYSMTVHTDASSYSGLQPIAITGTIYPVPGANTAVVITIKNSAGAVADVTEVVPNAMDGSFGYASHPGGNAAWTSGTFTVNATWGGNGAVASSVVTFTYSPNSNSSSTSTSSSSSSTSSSSSSSTSIASSSTSSSSSSSTSETTSTSAPEFPSSALALVALIGVAVVAVFSRSFRLGPAGRPGR